MSAEEKPHSRACGIRKHDHGPDCHSNCPTCGSKTWLRTMTKYGKCLSCQAGECLVHPGGQR